MLIKDQLAHTFSVLPQVIEAKRSSFQGKEDFEEAVFMEKTTKLLSVVEHFSAQIIGVKDLEAEDHLLSACHDLLTALSADDHKICLQKTEMLTNALNNFMALHVAETPSIEAREEETPSNLVMEIIGEIRTQTGIIIRKRFQFSRQGSAWDEGTFQEINRSLMQVRIKYKKQLLNKIIPEDPEDRWRIVRDNDALKNAAIDNFFTCMKDAKNTFESKIVTNP